MVVIKRNTEMVGENVKSEREQRWESRLSHPVCTQVVKRAGFNPDLIGRRAEDRHVKGCVVSEKDPVREQPTKPTPHLVKGRDIRCHLWCDPVNRDIHVRVEIVGWPNEFVDNPIGLKTDGS
jgi:hypothetical protein